MLSSLSSASCSSEHTPKHRNKTISNLSSRLSQYSASKIREQALTNNTLPKNKSILKKSNSLTFSRNVSFLLEDEQVWTNNTMKNNDSVLTKVSSDIDCLSNGWNASSGTNTNCSLSKTSEKKANTKQKKKKKRRYFFKNKNSTQNMTKKQVNTVYNPTVAAYGKIFNAQVLNTRKDENNVEYENNNSKNFDKFNNRSRNFGNNDEEKFLQTKNAINTKYTSSSYSYYNNDVHNNESSKFLSPDVTTDNRDVFAGEQRYFASSGEKQNLNLISLDNGKFNNRHLKLTNFEGKTLTDGVCDDVVRETRGLDYGYSFGDIGYSISPDNEEFNFQNLNLGITFWWVQSRKINEK